MALGALLGEYIAWHYTAGIREYIRAWANIHWFFYHYFSISALARSFFAPFHRIQEARKRGFNPEDWFEVFIVNTLMRAVGMLVRTSFIAVGLAAEIVMFCIGVFGFLFFIFAPVVISASLIGGSMLLIF